jgi:hypothetical protein
MIFNKMSEITLPVSLGEAIDKLSILHIKHTKISDKRQNDVKKEFDILFKILENYVEKHKYHYKILYKINLRLWELQDMFHNKDTLKEDSVNICRTILIENDRRYRVKAKINTAANSVLREQKGYNLKKAMIYSHLGLGDMYWMNGAIRYLATDYDEVLVVCKRRNEKNVREMYADDSTIQLYLIDDDIDLHPWPLKKHIFSSQGYTVFGCGGFSNKETPVLYNLPESFYDDINIPHEFRNIYFHVPRTEESLALVKLYNCPYVVVHEQSSVQRLPIVEHLRQLGETRLILDLNKNSYSKDTHPNEWELAEHVVNKPILDYTYLLEKADEIHVIESSIYCLASHLDLNRVKQRVCYDPWGGNSERLGVFKTGTTLRPV